VVAILQNFSRPASKTDYFSLDSMTRLAFFLLAVLLGACGFGGSVVKSVVYADHGGLSPAEYDAGIVDSIETQLSREVRGQHPEAGTKTWTEYWR
jgi:hypothetical protein